MDRAPVVLNLYQNMPHQLERSSRDVIVPSSSGLRTPASMGTMRQLSGQSHALPDDTESEMLQQRTAQQGNATNQASTSGRGRSVLPRMYSQTSQSSQQRGRHRQRYYAQQHRRQPAPPQQHLPAWMYLKVFARMRKTTVMFFDALDSGRVEAVRELVQSQPSLLLRTRPGTRWTAVHHVAERGEFGTLTALFEEAQRLDQAAASSRGAFACMMGSSKSNEYVQRMVNSLTEKNLTPLMLACKRGCACAHRKC